MRSLIQSRRRQGHPRRYVFIPDGQVAVTVSNCTSALQGSRRTTEYPSQFANYLGNLFGNLQGTAGGGQIEVFVEATATRATAAEGDRNSVQDDDVARCPVRVMNRPNVSFAESPFSPPQRTCVGREDAVVQARIVI